MNNKVLIILGMHRSGTSMLAQWLSACGLNLGDKLQGKTKSNKFGHYEDSEFYNFHRRLLSQNHENFLLVDDKPLKISDRMSQEAKKILKKRKELSQWGWKEPRTCLFIPLWDELLPDAYSIVIYRHYDEVVDSLYRRESDVKKGISKMEATYRIFELISYKLRKDYHYNQFLKSWILHNRKLLDYIKEKDRRQVLTFDVDELLQNDDTIFDKLTEWGFKLKKIPITDVFSKNSMKRNSLWANFDKKLQKEADDILIEFKQLKEISNSKI